MVLSFEDGTVSTDRGLMNLTIQGKSVRYDGTPDLKSLLEAYGENSLYVNVRLNEEVLERRDFENVPIAEGDKVDFLYFMGGGIRLV